ncbi:ABC transporter substrate-binding protein [Cellulosilyticum sp. I15G10I2]|uniref:ABC transporter substrate-binding protein n=1 Tax=Cellulosilyticum sp. I15G10I2 TaxID=1892843 RepID=UPI00085C9DE8|nr:extracellular solute-binding protein [Cellulosilyticum sp. I15G10I2]
MKNTIKRLGAMFLAGTMIFSMTACGGKTESNSSAATGDAKVTQAEDEQVTIKIAWWGSDTRHKYTQELLDLYTEKNPHVKFEASPSGWDGYFEKLSTQAASGSMPDIVQMDYLYISTYAKNNSLADLQEFIDSGVIDVSNVDENILNTGSIGGKRAGIPISTAILAMTYNPTVIEAAGADMPTDAWTWDDYIALNTKVAEKTGEPSALVSIIGPFGDTNPFNYWVRQHGKALFNENGTGLGFEDDAITTDYFKMWKDMSDANVSPDLDEQSLIASVGKEALPIVTDKAATTIEWNNFAAMVRGANDKLKLALMPSASESNALWLKPGMFLSVAESSKVKEESAKFINWMMNSEEANDIIGGERGTPVSSAIRDYMINKGTLTAQQIDMFEYVTKAAKVAGATPAADPSGISEVNEAFTNAGNSVLYGKATAEEAAATFRKQATEILERNNAAK